MYLNKIREQRKNRNSNMLAKMAQEHSRMNDNSQLKVKTDYDYSEILGNDITLQASSLPQLQSPNGNMSYHQQSIFNAYNEQYMNLQRKMGYDPQSNSSIYANQLNHLSQLYIEPGEHNFGTHLQPINRQIISNEKKSTVIVDETQAQYTKYKKLKRGKQTTRQAINGPGQTTALITGEGQTN